MTSGRFVIVYFYRQVSSFFTSPIVMLDSTFEMHHLAGIAFRVEPAVFRMIDKLPGTM